MNKNKNILTGVLGVLLSTTSVYSQTMSFEPSGNTKTLVAYFSATGNTRAVANRIAELTGADIYEIEPVRPYAANPYDDSQLIQNEAYNDLRPSVTNLPAEETVAHYDTIYVGSPLWWHQPAMVVCTFLETYDLSGKVVVPFITYGATTYLNEGMQKLFKCTPNSIHVPEKLPEDIDPDNIREPQNDDAGIDVPNRVSQVEEWLKRMGLWPPKETTGIAGVTSNNDSLFSIRNHKGGITVSTSKTGSVNIYDMAGNMIYSASIEYECYVPLSKGLYLVNIKVDDKVSNQKVIVI